jgi:hypothetical protein
MSGITVWRRLDVSRTAQQTGETICGLVLASKVGADLLLHDMFDLVDLLQPIDVLINLAGIGSDVARTRTFVTLHKDQIRVLADHCECER